MRTRTFKRVADYRPTTKRYVYRHKNHLNLRDNLSCRDGERMSRIPSQRHVDRLSYSNEPVKYILNRMTSQGLNVPNKKLNQNFDKWRASLPTYYHCKEWRLHEKRKCMFRVQLSRSRLKYNTHSSGYFVIN